MATKAKPKVRGFVEQVDEAPNVIPWGFTPEPSYDPYTASQSVDLSRGPLPVNDPGLMDMYNAATQASMGFFTGSNPVDSVQRARRGLLQGEQFSPNDLGFVRNMPPGEARDAAARAGAQLVDPINLATLPFGGFVRGGIAAGIGAEELARPIARKLGASQSQEDMVGAAANIAGNMVGPQVARIAVRGARRAAPSVAGAARRIHAEETGSFSLRPRNSGDELPKTVNFGSGTPAGSRNFDRPQVPETLANKLRSILGAHEAYEISGTAKLDIEAGRVPQVLSGHEAAKLGRDPRSAMSGELRPRGVPADLTEQELKRIQEIIIRDAADDPGHVYDAATALGALDKAPTGVFINRSEREMLRKYLGAQDPIQTYGGAKSSTGRPVAPPPDPTRRIGVPGDRSTATSSGSAVVNTPVPEGYGPEKQAAVLARADAERAAALARSKAAAEKSILESNVRGGESGVPKARSGVPSSGRAVTNTPVPEGQPVDLGRYTMDYAGPPEKRVWPINTAGAAIGAAQGYTSAPEDATPAEVIRSTLYGAGRGLAVASIGQTGARRVGALQAARASERAAASKRLYLPPATRIERAKGLAADIAKVFSPSEVIGTLRTTAASLDFSGTLRQGGFLGPRHSRELASMFKAQVEAAMSETRAAAIMDDINTRPGASYRNQTELYMGDWRTTDLTRREEQFASSLAGEIPGVKQSSRAYAVGLNKYRADMFDAFVFSLPEDARTPERLNAYAKYINAATGRGSLPAILERYGPILNAVFFSPRFIASIPQRFAAGFTRDPYIRAEVLKDSAAFFGTGLAMLGAAYAAKQYLNIPDSELKIDGKDWENPDWGKALVGNSTSIDFWGGHQQYARMMLRVATATPAWLEAAQSGSLRDLKQSENPLAIMEQFLRYKFAPPADILDQLATGKTAMGQPAPPVGTMLQDAGTPLALNDLFDAFNVWEKRTDTGTAAAATGGFGVLGSLGVSTQTYPRGKKASSGAKYPVATYPGSKRR